MWWLHQPVLAPGLEVLYLFVLIIRRRLLPCLVVQEMTHQDAVKALQAGLTGLKLD